MDVAFVVVSIIFFLICVLFGLIAAGIFACALKIIGYKRRK